MRALLVLLLALPAGAAAAADPYADLPGLLERRVFPARIHESLWPSYGLAVDDAATLTISGQRFSTALAPVAVGEDDGEEWPAVMGGTAYLLDDAVYVPLLASLAALIADDAEQRSDIQRLVMQSRLWTAFDRLYLDGIHPRRHPDQQRWRRLLRELALAVRAVALDEDRIAALPDDGGIRRRLLGDGPAAEVYSFEAAHFHDLAHDRRRLTRIFYRDPVVDFAAWNADERRAGLVGGVALAVGGMAVLEEHAVAITPTMYLVPTQLPLVVKSYRIVAGVDRPRAGEFILRHLAPAADGPPTFVEAGSRAEAWGFIDLPNIPGFEGHPALRVPMTMACAECHSPRPRSQRPGYQDRDADLLRFAPVAAAMPRAPAAIALQAKSSSAEYRALIAYATSSVGLLAVDQEP